MPFEFSRRQAFKTIVATSFIPIAFQSAKGIDVLAATSTSSLPIRWDGAVAGDGFHIRHGFTCENTWYNPGWWHTGEDWYARDGEETGGAEAVSVDAGNVVFVGSDYPGRVIIVRHADELYSMYGHLDPAVDVAEADLVEPGQRLGRVLTQIDARAPSHLHFEIRTFLFSTEVNGDVPRYDVGCGFQCAPGPGYWPIDAPETPAAIGWRNPVHHLAASFATGEGTMARAVVSADGDGKNLNVFAMPENTGDIAARLNLVMGDAFALLDVRTGDPAGAGQSAEAYALWFRLSLPDETSGWVSAIETSSEDTGSDGRPSGITFNLLPSE